MNKYLLAMACGLFVLGAVVGHALTVQASVTAGAKASEISPFDLMLKAKDLPVETADAV
jgi:hypothetical protein